jgi:glyoxylase-like metal-dependent hydrolase (beta-lactamase superfamily II)
LSDGSFAYSGDQYVANADRGDVERALARHGAPPDRIPSQFTCLLVESGGRRVLVDTGGGGSLGPTAGKLSESLAAARLGPAEVDLVVLTHAHPDHVGWLADDDAKPVFANARHAMLRAEWEYWTDAKVLAAVPGVFSASIRKNLPPIQDRVDLFDHETEVAPGIVLTPAPGHTPGQAAVIVSSARDELLYISDAALHPIHLEQPDWYPVFDLDPPAAVASRRELFDRAADNGSLVLAFHFDPFPSLGRVTHAERGWTWAQVD